MAGAGSVVRVVAGVTVLAFIAIVTGVSFQILDALFLNLDFSDAASLGWDNTTAMMRFAGLSLIALSLAMVMWMVLAPIKRDVRQELQ